MNFNEIKCECGAVIAEEDAISLPGREAHPMCYGCATYTVMMDAEDEYRDRQAAPKPVTIAASVGNQWILERTAPYFAAIGNGLYVRTGNGRKRRAS